MVWAIASKNSIGYATSKDLFNWTEQKELPVMESESTVQNAGSPELHYERFSKTFYITWASTIPGRFPATEKTQDGYDNRIYYTSTKDFKTFSKTKLLFNPEFPVSEATIFKRNGRSFLFFANDVDNKIQYSSSHSVKSFPASVSEAISGKNFAKNPYVVQIRKYSYVYWEDSKNKRIEAIRCKKLSNPEWEDITSLIHFPGQISCGSVFMVKKSILIKLQNMENQAGQQ
jgi:beta-galactosidase